MTPEKPLNEMLRKLFRSEESKRDLVPLSRLIVRQATPQKRQRKSCKGSHEVSKVRRKMAAKSNHINRQRCRRWKH